TMTVHQCTVMVHQSVTAKRSRQISWVLRVRTGVLLTPQQCNRHAAIRKNLATSGFCELTDIAGRVNWYDMLDHSGRADMNSITRPRSPCDERLHFQCALANLS